MASTVTTKAPLGATTLNRKWYLDVNTGTKAVPVWTGVFGITDFKPLTNGTLQDDSDFDGGGYKSQTQTAIDWGAELKVRRGVTEADPTAYDPGQEVLRIASLGMGVDNSVDIRYYEVTPGGPKVEAYRGRAAVTYEDDGGDLAALSTASIKLAGQGKRTPIAHPGITV
jgi:hypothetical protein